MRTVKEYANEVEHLSNNAEFSVVDGLINELSALYAYRNVEMGKLEAMRATFIDELSKSIDKISMVKCNAEFDATLAGLELIKLKREVESLTRLIKACENLGFSLRSEARLISNS